MKTSITDWLITALAYIIICALLSVISHEEDSQARQPAQRHGGQQHAYATEPHYPASGAAASATATAHASIHASADVSSEADEQAREQQLQQAQMKKLAQEAGEMTGMQAKL